MPDTSEGRRGFPLAWTIGLFALACVALASPWIWGNVTIPYDAKSQFYPQLAFLARSLATGQSPFWTPNVFAGWPQIADPQSLIFSPVYLVLALISPAPGLRAFDAMVFVLLFVGGLGVILYFRDRGWHAGGALVAALAFAFGGSAASRIQHIGQVESLVFFPLTLLFLSRALERSSWRDGVIAGVFAAMVVLGRDQVSLLVVYVLSGYVLWYWLSSPSRARFVASLKPLAAGGITGLLIAAVPVVLSAMLALDSNRPEIDLVDAGRGSLHPAHFMMLVFPDLFGASDPYLNFWGPPGFPWHERFGMTDLYLAQNAGQIYAGAVVIVALIGLGLIRGLLWAPEIRFFTVAMVLTGLYALGKYTPAFQFMYEFLPGVSLFRRPADASFIFCALLAIIAGYLVHRWLTGTVPPPARWQRAAEVGVAIALLATAVGLAIVVGTLNDAAIPILIAIGFAAAAVAVLWVARRLAVRHAVAALALLTAFGVADFAWNNAPNESTGLPREDFDALRRNSRDEIVALLKAKLAATAAPDRRDRVEIIGVAYHWPNVGLIHDFDHLFGHNPLRFADFVQATAAPDTVAGPDQRKFTPLMPSYRSTLEDLLGVRFIVSSVPVEKIDTSLKPGDLKEIARFKNATVYENPRALPRVLLATRWREADFEVLLRDGGWPDVDPRHTVLLEQAPEGFTPGDAGGSARIVNYRNTDIVVETDAPQGGILVLNDIWHPWWRAAVDGKPVEILKANVLFRGVVVPPGKHEVRFTFHPFAGAFAQLMERFTAPWE